MNCESLCPQPAADAVGPQAREHIVIRLASEKERQCIYRLRHEVYARELGQHPLNVHSCLRDKLDDWNYYLIAQVGGSLAGFISITPPGRESYSIDKYVARSDLPFPIDRPTRLWDLLRELAEGLRITTSFPGYMGVTRLSRIFLLQFQLPARRTAQAWRR